ncbi:DUF4118 domain-containing protein [Azoarcus sp. L1K30]|uniref:DUF4118 domain-containing protein n=1 Tax=Azoarcus sp. L1K30 TaxID=2820277 RepID=UPI002012615C|nr:DUF4118 domain-containing protein [Azoarcus sp. L1K30]
MPSGPRWRDYFVATLAVGAVAAVGAPLLGTFDLANVAMLFPLVVLVAAVRLGRGPAVLAAFLSVALFDFFFVHPHFTFAVSDFQYLLTFAVLLAVALITAALAARLGEQRDAAETRGREARLLCGTAQALSAAVSAEEIGALRAQSVFTLDGNAPESLRETYASLFSTALERVHYQAEAERRRVEAEAERMRSALLATLSHDLRTPLTALAGLAESLPLAGPPLPASQAELADAIRTEALRIHALARDLLDLARLQSGTVTLRREWLPIEEVVGAALRAQGAAIGAHELTLALPDSLPLVELDPVLMERVLCNLIENAAHHTPCGGQITVGAVATGNTLTLAVSDNGPGLPAAGSPPAGTGLGLVIVRAIIEAHGGTMNIDSPPGGGVRVNLHLPLSTPPLSPELEE